MTVILRGGLGNQMFEYAAGLNRAIAQGERLVLDTTYLNDRFPRRQFTYRTYDLDVFKLEPEFSALSKLSAAVPIPGVWVGIDLAAHALKKTFGLDKRNPTPWGFYQSEKYFAKNAAAVRQAFQFREPLVGEAARLAKEIRVTNSVSLHVRRADYLLPKYAELYGKTDTDYYDRAIAHIAGKVRDPHFYIVSDDLAWCREHIKPAYPTTYIDDSSRGPKSSFHLRLMSLCKHNIIANSSFSWWGAWLNENPEKIVIAPKHWSQEASVNTDVIPASWFAM